MLSRHQRFVVGFLFSPDYESVILIKKNKPKWQEGLLNGVGGKIELTGKDNWAYRDETPLEAMIREFEEEAGLHITDWKEFAVMSGNDWQVNCFKATSADIGKVKSLTDEIVYPMLVEYMNEYKTIPNLKWLIPMALDKDNFVTEIKYK